MPFDQNAYGFSLSPSRDNTGFGLNQTAGFGSKGAGAFGKSLQGYGMDAQAAAQEANNRRQQIAQQGGIQAGLLGQQQAGETQRAEIAADASKYAPTLQQSRFNSIFPYLTGQLQNGAHALTAGGQSPPSPEITVGPVWNDQQIQQQVNSLRAANDATAANQTRQDQQSAAGRGFGASSPLLKLLGATRQMGAMQQNTAGEMQARQTAAQENARQILATQQAREAQFASRQQEDIERRKPQLAYQSSILAALSGLV